MKQSAGKKQLRVTIACILLLIINVQALFAQERSGWKWLSPTEAPFSVMEGRGWQTGLDGSYNRLPARAKEIVRTDVWHLSENSAGIYLNFKPALPVSWCGTK
jgi:N-terminus of Esterase_SGNH_hydro-type